MKKTILWITGLLIVSAVVFATVFETELGARNDYNTKQAKPRFMQLEVYDVVQKLDSDVRDYYWDAKSYSIPNPTINDTVDFQVTDVMRINMTQFTEVQAFDKIQVEAELRINVYEYEKPLFKVKTDSNYGKKVTKKIK